MTVDTYKTVHVRREDGVAYVTIDHPPINLFDLHLIAEMDHLGAELAEDDAVRVVVFDSANPDFFIAHADVTLIQGLPDSIRAKSEAPNPFQRMVERYRTMPKATIAKIEGRARGGGSEFALSLDMRFGAIGRAILAQPEVALGILPGGSGTQRLPRLVGRGRALEVILGCADFDAATAERYGLLNRALPADEIGTFVQDLATRIASYPAYAIALAKASVSAAEMPLAQGLAEESHCFNLSVADPAARRRMQRFMDHGGQTYQIELDLEALLGRLDDEAD